MPLLQLPEIPAFTPRRTSAGGPAWFPAADALEAAGRSRPELDRKDPADLLTMLSEVAGLPVEVVTIACGMIGSQLVYGRDTEFVVDWPATVGRAIQVHAVVAPMDGTADDRTADLPLTESTAVSWAADQLTRLAVRP